MKSLFTSIILCFAFSSSQAQVTYSSDLFATQDVLKIRMRLSFKELKKETDDSTYIDNVIQYEVAGGEWDSIQIELRKRGHYRLDHCYFPPLKVAIKKKARKGTLFEDNKKLKLVLPCKKSNENNSLIIKEFLCYKIYEQMTPYTFNTRLVSIDLVETSKKNDLQYNLMGFFIEDDKRVAKRHGAQILKDVEYHPARLHDTTAVRYALFQYLIANLDWSTTVQHNTKIMQTMQPYRNIPLAYDFDQSGFVNASYAFINSNFDIKDVRERLYRGLCREDNSVLYFVRDEYLEKQDLVFEILDDYKSYLKEYDFNSLKKFVEEFYLILQDDKLFERKVLDDCRG